MAKDFIMTTPHNDSQHESPPPTSSSVLDLCNLPASSTSTERATRLARLKSWFASHSETMLQLLTSSENRDKKTGCMPLHWMAGTGFDEAIDFVLDYYDAAVVAHNACSLSMDQQAHHPSTHRTPLHYSARNGHLSTCRLLVERYGADPHPKCGRGGVTPLQLAVWQNRLSIVQYLVDRNGARVVHERNGFNCGLMHWIGLVPKKRWGGGSQNNDEMEDEEEDNGLGVMPLARYLHALGIVYESTPENSNTQGHSPNHKAAWGGNLQLMKYFRDEHGVFDTVQDAAGNYCADLAKMRGNEYCQQWLLEHGSGDRANSYNVLGLDVGADMDIVRKRFMELARCSHPDKANQHNTNDEKKEDTIVDDFIKIKAAYEHLTKEGGMGKQKNPKFDELKLLKDHQRMHDTHDNKSEQGSSENDDDLFMARLIAVLSDYGDDGFPVSLIARRWNQIWPDRPFPTECIIERTVKCSKQDGDGSGMMVLRKKAKLLKWLRWKCKGSSVYFRNIAGDVLAFDSARQKDQTDGE